MEGSQNRTKALSSEKNNTSALSNFVIASIEIISNAKVAPKRRSRRVRQVVGNSDNDVEPSKIRES